MNFPAFPHSLMLTFSAIPLLYFNKVFCNFHVFCILQSIHCNSNRLFEYNQDILAMNTLQRKCAMIQKLRSDNSFGNNLRKIRKSHGYTQEEIVAKLQLKNIDISRSVYAQIECGTYNIRVSELIALKEIYNISFDEFFDGLSIE